MIPRPVKSPAGAIFLLILALFGVRCSSASEVNASLTYLWPLPSEFTSGNDTLSVDPGLSLSLAGRDSAIVRAAFDRYKGIIFRHANAASPFRGRNPLYDVRSLRIVVESDNEDVSQNWGFEFD